MPYRGYEEAVTGSTMIKYSSIQNSLTGKPLRTRHSKTNKTNNLTNKAY
ncbi:hypothetical protein [Vulcanisaeta souniana]|nr:hypothetical protein [Vulcanisaeta souniana]